MPEKKAGLWRGTYEKGKPAPTRCRDCRSTNLEFDLIGQDDTQDGEYNCRFCGARDSDYGLVHADDCPIMRARKLLGMEEA